MNRTSLQNSDKVKAREKKRASKPAAAKKTKKNPTRTKKIVKAVTTVALAALAGDLLADEAKPAHRKDHYTSGRGTGKGLKHSQQKAGGYDAKKRQSQESQAKASLEQNEQGSQSSKPDQKSSADQKQKSKEAASKESSSNDLKNKTGQSQRDYDNQRKALNDADKKASSATRVIAATSAPAVIAAGALVASKLGQSNKATSSNPSVPPGPPDPQINKPILRAINPTSGMATGGDRIQLVGEYLTEGATVIFGGNPATVLQVAPDGKSMMVFSAPGNIEQKVDVSVTTKGGSDTLSAAFLYLNPDIPPPVVLPPPFLDHLSHTMGSLAGGKPMSVIGQNFTPDALVYFGQQLVAAAYVDETRLDLNCPSAPGNQAGGVPVFVRTQWGDSGTQTFTYEADPIVPPVVFPPSPDPVPTGNTAQSFWSDNKVIATSASAIVLLGLGAAAYGHIQAKQANKEHSAFKKTALYDGIAYVMRLLGYGAQASAIRNFVGAGLSRKTVLPVRMLIDRIEVCGLAEQSAQVFDWLNTTHAELAVQKDSEDPINPLQACIVSTCIARYLLRWVKKFSKQKISSEVREALNEWLVRYSLLSQACFEKLSEGRIYTTYAETVFAEHRRKVLVAAKDIQETTPQDVHKLGILTRTLKDLDGQSYDGLQHAAWNLTTLPHQQMQASEKQKRLALAINITALAVEAAAFYSAGLERDAEKSGELLQKFVTHFDNHLVKVDQWNLATPALLLHSLVFEEAELQWIEGLEEDAQTLQLFKNKTLSPEDKLWVRALVIRNVVRRYRLHLQLQHNAFEPIKILFETLCQDVNAVLGEESPDPLWVVANQILELLTLEVAPPQAIASVARAKEEEVCPSCQRPIDFLNYKEKDLSCPHCHLPWAVFNPTQGKLLFEELKAIRMRELEPLAAGERYSVYVVTVCWILGFLFPPCMPLVITSVLNMMGAVTSLSYATFSMMNKAIAIRDYYQHGQQHTETRSVIRICFSFFHEAIRFLKGLVRFLPFANIIASLVQGLNALMAGIRGTHVLATLGVDLNAQARLGYERYHQKLKTEEKRIAELFTSSLDRDVMGETSGFHGATQSYHRQACDRTIDTITRSLNQSLPDILALFPSRHTGLSVELGSFDTEYVDTLLKNLISSTAIDGFNRAELVLDNVGYSMMVFDTKDIIESIFEEELGYHWDKKKPKQKLPPTITQAPFVKALSDHQEQLNTSYAKLVDKSDSLTQKLMQINRIINLIKIIPFIEFKAFGGDVFPFQVKLIQSIVVLGQVERMLPQSQGNVRNQLQNFAEHLENTIHALLPSGELGSTADRTKCNDSSIDLSYRSDLTVKKVGLSAVEEFETLKVKIKTFKQIILEGVRCNMPAHELQHAIDLYYHARAFHYFYSVLTLYRGRAKKLHEKYGVSTRATGGLNLWGSASRGLGRHDTLMSQATEPLEYRQLLSKIENVKAILQSMLI